MNLPAVSKTDMSPVSGYHRCTPLKGIATHDILFIQLLHSKVGEFCGFACKIENVVLETKLRGGQAKWKVIAYYVSAIQLRINRPNFALFTSYDTSFPAILDLRPLFYLAQYHRLFAINGRFCRPKWARRHRRFNLQTNIALSRRLQLASPVQYADSHHSIITTFIHKYFSPPRPQKPHKSLTRAFTVVCG